uniref:Uncharacterized protein n=1 Tax=Arundo donax TaxID=35708 RepID=A0A0A9EUR2_ARUDO
MYNPNLSNSSLLYVCGRTLKAFDPLMFTKAVKFIVW